MQSLAHQFLDFCRAKPAGEVYNYVDGNNCAICQFLRDTGYPVRVVYSSDWEDADGTRHKLPYMLRGITGGGPGLINEGKQPFTFGALADRLSATLNRDGAER